MSISYVLRLRPEELADGHFIGEIEAVGTGQRDAIRSLDQIAAFIRETASSEASRAPLLPRATVAARAGD